MTCIICELNPLHNGHKFLIDEASEDTVVLIMSGNYTQRGSAAVYDKYTRAKAAVKAGADLVVELPFPWCSAGAADFAAAGVRLAHAMGADRLVFGSGSGNGELLSKAGRAFAEADFDAAFAEASKADPAEGAARLRERILGEYFTPDEARILSNPNDILGIEYYRYAHETGLECTPVLRCEGGNVTSATTIRSMIYENGIACVKEYIPAEAFDVFAEAVPTNEAALYHMARILLRTDRCDTDAAECEGGLGHRLRRIAGECADGSELLRLAATKKYTDARIRRALLYSIFGIRREQLRTIPSYTTVLGIGKNGAEVLKRLKKSESIEVLTKAADHGKLSDAARSQFEVSAAADRFYTMLMGQPRPEEYFLSVTPYVEK